MSELYLIDNKIVLSGCFILDKTCQKILLLYRKDHRHNETPGGKVELKDLKDINNSTVDDFAITAEREQYEELGKDINLGKFAYFGSKEFTLPNGKIAIANKFLTTIRSGEPKIQEPDLFSKLRYLPIDRLQHYSTSPDLKLFKDQLKDTKNLKRIVHPFGFNSTIK